MLYDKVIFVCRDNICQSPAAVTILNSIKKDEWLEVSSRGLVVLFSEPYSMKIHSLLRNHGIIMDNGVSRPLEEKDFGENTIILTMTRAQKDKYYPNIKMPVMYIP
jgi:putative phosphotyrosine protein phosphatase